jgi:hypothetical protein
MAGIVGPQSCLRGNDSSSGSGSSTRKAPQLGGTLERQREGIAKAKAEGRYKGRPPSVDPEAIRRLKGSGIGPAMIVKRLKVARSTVYRLLDAHA